MANCLQAICCCIQWQTTPPKPALQGHKRHKSKRLSTKFKLQQVKIITDQERRSGIKPAYACPICFLYFNKILACSQCQNFICHSCYEQYNRKSHKRMQKMKCAFCFSIKSLFMDYELEAHSYFDTTNKGFLSKQQRSKIDKELSNKLDNVEQQSNHQIIESNRDFENRNNRVEQIQQVERQNIFMESNIQHRQQSLQIPIHYQHQSVQQYQSHNQGRIQQNLQQNGQYQQIVISNVNNQINLQHAENNELQIHQQQNNILQHIQPNNNEANVLQQLHDRQPQNNRHIQQISLVMFEQQSSIQRLPNQHSLQQI